MPADREEAQRGQREHPYQDTTRGADGLVHAVRERGGEHAHELLGGTPQPVVDREARARHSADSVRQQQDEPCAEGRRPGRGQAS